MQTNLQSLLEFISSHDDHLSSVQKFRGTHAGTYSHSPFIKLGRPQEMWRWSFFVVLTVMYTAGGKLATGIDFVMTGLLCNR